MIACISPGSSSADHSLNTLRYADRLKEKSGSNKNFDYAPDDYMERAEEEVGLWDRKPLKTMQPRNNSRNGNVETSPVHFEKKQQHIHQQSQQQPQQNLHQFDSNV